MQNLVSMMDISQHTFVTIEFIVSLVELIDIRGSKDDRKKMEELGSVFTDRIVEGVAKIMREQCLGEERTN